MDDLIHCKKCLSKDTSYDFDMNAIIDFRNCKLDVDLHSRDFKDFTDFKKRTFPKHKNRRVAYLCDGPSQYILSVLYDEFINEVGLHQDAECFTTNEATAKWYGNIISKKVLSDTIVELENAENRF